MLLYNRIEFLKPDIEKLRANGCTLFDMHFHSRYSDGISKVTAILKKAKRMGIGVSITDHNVIKGSLEASKYKDAQLIPGVEITSSEGIHTLLYFYKINDLKYFYNKHIAPNIIKNYFSFLRMGIVDLIDLSKEYNCLICAAHPYAIAWQGMCKPYHSKYITKDVLNKIDIIEVITGSNLRKRNLKAVWLADSLKKSISGGSDGHSIFELGKVLTYAKEVHDAGSFLDSIKNKKNSVIGKETTLIYRSASQSVKLRLPTKTPVPYIKKGISYLKKKIQDSNYLMHNQ